MRPWGQALWRWNMEEIGRKIGDGLVLGLRKIQHRLSPSVFCDFLKMWSSTKRSLIVSVSIMHYTGRNDESERKRTCNIKLDSTFVHTFFFFPDTLINQTQKHNFLNYMHKILSVNFTRSATSVI